MRDRRTIWAAELQSLLRFVTGQHAAISTSELLEAAAVPELLSLSPDARVPITSVWALWRAAVDATSDRTLPTRFGLATRLEDMGLMGFAVLTAATVGEAARHASRFLHLTTDSAQLDVIEHHDSFVMRWQREGARSGGHELANETVLAQIVAAVTQIAGRGTVTRVRFRHAAPERAAEIARLLGCPIDWAAAQDEVLMPATVQKRPSPAGNPAMAAYFQARIAERHDRSPTLVERVRADILESLRTGEPDVRATARRLGASERTLRRELAREGTTFRELVRAVRAERAEQLLGDPRLSLTEIAFALGFSEHSAFTRAFSRWFGVPPASYRGALTAEARPAR